ncbi:hypothetical protein [Lacticaseibacillus suibinensis]|uniref:hypothetical protein n=1 Tax=Lacticaseibacillus suibinensis TaxID=2486011 RepID=UPI00194275D5|nr:hypothetical protein [Lacticaseibacillus suibinensis]
MTQHTYIAYSGFMLAGGVRDWQEEVTAASPAAALQAAIISIFVHTGRLRYPNEFGSGAKLKLSVDQSDCV